MKKKDILKKLSLSKETVSVLTSYSLNKVKGGAKTDPLTTIYIEDGKPYPEVASLY